MIRHEINIWNLLIEQHEGLIDRPEHIMKTDPFKSFDQFSEIAFMFVFLFPQSSAVTQQFRLTLLS